MFNKIFYINLDRRTDRKNHVITELKNVNMYNISERINAIDGKKININDLPDNLISNVGKIDALDDERGIGIPLTRGAVGCALSHREAYLKIIDQKLNSALIIEDDVRFDKLFNQKLNNIFQNLPKDYDIIYLGYSQPSIKYFDNNVYNNIFKKSSSVYGLFGYVVSNTGAQKLLDIFPITVQLDSEISNNFNKINAYLVKPEDRIIFSDPSSLTSQFGTDIQYRKDYTYKKKLYLFIIVVLTLFISFDVVINIWFKK